jgi:hypothetical protein
MQDMCLQTSDDGTLDGTALAEWQVVSIFLGWGSGLERDDLLIGGKYLACPRSNEIHRRSLDECPEL